MAKDRSQNGSELARLREELEQLRAAVAELELLNEIALQAGASTDVDQTLQEIVQRCLRAFGAEQGSIHLLAGGERDVLRTLVRRDDRSRIGEQYDVSSAITGWVLAHEEPLLITSLPGDDRFHVGSAGGDIRTLLCAPIWFEGGIIGLLTIVNRKDGSAFTQRDRTLLSIVAIQAGQLIKSAELREDNARRRREADEARWEAEKLQELVRWKSTLFTGIAHELRTPLALILGPLEQLMSGIAPGGPERQYMLMHHQAARLLHRVNDLLALATIDAGAMKLVLGPCDVSGLVGRVVASFSAAAVEKQIDLRSTTAPSGENLFCDAEKVETVVTNLVANALRFTGAGGQVAVSVGEGPGEAGALLEISVEDTGIGIAEEELERIFDRYRRSPGAPLTESAGIGLALVKELVELHQGTVACSSVLNKGTRFTVRLPVSMAYYHAKGVVFEQGGLSGRSGRSDASAGHVQPATATGEDLASSRVLVVEDDGALREFIAETLTPAYAVSLAKDGDEGLRQALDALPDLVISDVLMPGLDGFALCTRLKSDERTSHIPVVLLTSKAELESRLAGLEAGADEYLAKPFSPRELVLRVRNLLDQRRQLRERYRREISLEPEGIPVTPADERFLRRVKDAIEGSLANAEFSVDQLAREAGFSRTHLNRKLNALTGQSANEFMRTYRLKRGAQLLRERHGNISEVAYEVGFNNPSYFAESFRGLFGCSPSEYTQAGHPKT